MDKLFIGVVALVLFIAPVIALEDSVAVKRQLATELSGYGVGLLKVKSIHKGYIKGPAGPKYWIILAIVNVSDDSDKSVVHNPWATMVPACNDAGVSAEEEQEAGHVAAVLIDSSSTITEVLYEKNLIIGVNQLVELKIDRGDREIYNLNWQVPQGSKVLVFSSPGCEDRYIYWTGESFFFLITDEMPY